MPHTDPIEALRFGESPDSDLNGTADAEAVIEAVLLLAHRAVWLGVKGKLVYDLDHSIGGDVPTMRISVVVEPIPQ